MCHNRSVNTVLFHIATVNICPLLASHYYINLTLSFYPEQYSQNRWSFQGTITIRVLTNLKGCCQHQDIGAKPLKRYQHDNKTKVAMLI